MSEYAPFPSSVQWEFQQLEKKSVAHDPQNYETPYTPTDCPHVSCTCGPNDF